MSEVQKVYQPVDRGEDGRAYNPYEVVFTRQEDAAEVSKPDNYGRPSVRVLYVMRDLSEYEGWKRDEVRRKALAKLTREEQEALGLA